jgi:CheY-like chemotaxis protein
VVEDEGPGIPAGEIERIFRPFEQIRNVRRVGRETGLGLGLAIARAIVELHGGVLTVSVGAGGRGARFTVELPLVAAGSGATAPTAAEIAAEAAPEPLSILLVEDHSDTGRVIAQLLKGAGHDVVHAKTATAAFDCFRRGRFNFIISDIGLPDESGLVLMRRLRALKPSLAGLCMTGYGMESDQQACFAAGFSEHLAKPVDVQRLLAAINRTARQPERLSGV